MNTWGLSVLETVLVLVGLLASDNRTLEGLWLLDRRHHERRHVLEEKRRVRARRQLRGVQVELLQLLLDLLLKDPPLVHHWGRSSGTIQSLRRVVDGAHTQQSIAIRKVEAQAVAIHVHVEVVQVAQIVHVTRQIVLAKLLR